MLEFEEKLYARGFDLLAGVDEAGRGPWAGPVVAAAVIIPKGYGFSCRINDSKKLTINQRQTAFKEIIAICDHAYAAVDEKVIDAKNILEATFLAMQQAVHSLKQKPQYVLVDGNQIPQFDCPSSPIIGGDAKSLSIACASIIAKVVRDNIMLDYDQTYPEYGFAGHKGYGTKAHHQAIQKHGPCPIHRRSFQPIKSICSNQSLKSYA